MIPTKSDDGPDPQKLYSVRTIIYKNAEGENIFEQDNWRQEGARTFRSDGAGAVITTFEDVDPAQEESLDYWEEEDQYWERIHVQPRQNLFIPSHATFKGPPAGVLTHHRETFLRNLASKRDVMRRDTYAEEPQKMEISLWIGRTRFWKIGAAGAPTSDIAEVVESSEIDEIEEKSHESTVSRLKREALEIKHLLTHHPKNPYCKCCTYGKATSSPLRRHDPATKAEWCKFGDLVTADHMVLGAKDIRGLYGEKNAVLIRDTFTRWMDFYPVYSKSAAETVASFIEFQGRSTITGFYSDNSSELHAAALTMKWIHESCVPHRPATNGVVERAMRSVVDGTRTFLIQSGLPISWWSVAAKAFCFAHNVKSETDVDDDGVVTSVPSPYRLRHKENYVGELVPFGCLVRYLPPKPEREELPKFAPRATPGIFLGWHTQPGGKFKGEYLVVSRDHMMSDKTTGPLRINRVREMWKEDTFSFPLADAPPARKHELTEHDASESETRAIEESHEVLRVEPEGPKPSEIEEIPVPSDQGGIPEIDKPIPVVPPPVPDPNQTMKRLPKATLLDWKVGDPIPQGYKNRGGSLCETRKNSNVPPDFAPDVWRSFSAPNKKLLIAEHQKSLREKSEAEGATVADGFSGEDEGVTVADGFCDEERTSGPDISGSEDDSGCSTDDGVQRVICAAGHHKCSIFNAAPCEECFELCCDKHADGYFSGRKCVRCTGTLALAAKISTVVNNDGEITEPEDKEREANYQKVGPPPKLPTRRRRKQLHREKVRPIDIPFSALVARPVKRDEIKRTPAAQEALRKEWAKLRKAGCWDEKNVREWDDVMREARSSNKKAHNARLFEICVEKGSELPAGDPNRKFKGRVVLQGNLVKDEYFDHAIFAELSSCPSTMEAAKSCDAYGLMPGHISEQCDAEQAYAQAKIQGTDTWIEIPPHEWPASWKGMRRPVCLLILALYGHPDAGGYWEKHCEKHLLSIGFTQIAEWRSCYFHKKLQLFLTVYVDDFKMSGPRDNVKAGWKLIRQGVKTEEPTPSGKYLGCDHIEGFMDVTDFKNPLHPDLAQRKKENAATVPPYLGDGSKKRVRALKYDMKGFLAQCVERYVELTKIDKKKIVEVDTPFIDLPKDDPTVESPKAGALQAIASKVLMKILYAARMGRFDLLKATCALASRVTKWTDSCDKLLHRLVCYVHSTLDVYLHGWIGTRLRT